MLNFYGNPFMFNFMQFSMLQPMSGLQNYYFNPMQNYNFYQTPYMNSIFHNQNQTYNRAKGERLVQNALKGLPQKPPKEPLCAKYVKTAVVNSGLGNYVYGNGEEAKYMFRNNPNFKEYTAKGKDLKHLPAGAVVVYDANERVSDTNGNEKRIGKFGHVLFAKGDGTGISDRKENFIPVTDNAYVFIPV